MRRLILNKYFAVILFLTFTAIHAHIWATPAKDDKPSWTNHKTRKARYPKSTYVYGFSSAEFRGDETRKEFMNRLKGYARTRLAESVQVEIKSITTSNMITKNEVTANYFKQTSLSLAKVKVSGLKTETYFDEEEEAGYVFTYAKKGEISEDYQNRLALNISLTREHLSKAEEAASGGNTKKALQHYYKCHVKLRNVQEAQGLLMAMNGWQYNHPELKTQTARALKDSTEQGIEAIQSDKNLSLEGLSYFLAHGLSLQTNNLEKPVYLAAITYEDKGVASLFSKRLLTQLESDLNQQGIKVTTNSARFETRQATHLMLEGTYWKNKDNLKVILTIKNPENSETIASAEGKLPISYLDKNDIAYKPANYNKIQNDLQALNSNEFVSSGLNVKLSTNKGANNPVFQKDDTLKLYVKVNKPCYLRFIYHLADGTKVLMLDNQYVDRSKVNKVYQIPDLFTIASPFGAEVLQLNARTKSFDELNTEPYGHYKRIKDDIEKIIANVRGFKPVNDKEGHDEARVTLTTLPKGN